jgi:hypothetical protein
MSLLALHMARGATPSLLPPLSGHPHRLFPLRYYVDCLLLQLLSGAAPAADAAPAAEPPPSPEQIAAAEGLVSQQADAVRELKGLGVGNSHPEVQSQVQVRSFVVWVTGKGCEHGCRVAR